MPREKEGYRAELERIGQRFGDKQELSKKDVSDYTGACYRSVCKRFQFNDAGKITQSALARQLV